MKRNKGFSLIEVMVAVTIVAGLGATLSRLQISSLQLSKQMVTRQLMAMYADDLVSKMVAQINFVSVQPGDNGLTSSYLEAGSYGTHHNAYVDNVIMTKDCTKVLCDQKDLSGYYREEWENHIENQIKLSPAFYRLTICRDNTLATPVYDKDDPYGYKDNCSNEEFDPIVIKASWADATESSEKSKLAQNDNYLVFRVPGR